MNKCPTELTESIKRLAIVWFRNDLRLHDNLSLKMSIDLIDKKKIDYVLPFYCYDQQMFEGLSREAKLPRCNTFRRNFLVESVHNLKENLIRKHESNLYLAYGNQNTELIKLIDKIQSNHKHLIIDSVVASKEIASEEVDQEERLNHVLKEKKIKLTLVWDNTMIHLDDLPYSNNIQKMPDTFTQFRRTVEVNGESNYTVRKPYSIPDGYKLPTAPIDYDTSSEYQLPGKVDVRNGPEPGKSAIESMPGGETAALNRMIDYFFKTESLKIYKTTRNGLIGRDYSSKLSMWLANGCISTRLLYWKVKEFEQLKKQTNESTKAFVFELLWRDFFKFHTLKFGKKIFYLSGLHGKRASASYATEWKQDAVLFEKWCKGETGYPFVDANMRELNQTGWMSNRGRQNVASFLTKDLEIDWRFGAEYFESMLVDYDCTSNWGNWQYVAGIGVDPRGDRYFNVIKQAYDYDENGDFARLWLPELAKAPRDFIYCPWKLSLAEQRRLNCVIGKDYPQPVVKAKFDWNPNNRKVNKFAEKSKRNK